MPKMGDEISAYELGKKGTGHYIWTACIDCGKERWIRKGSINKRCPECGRKKMGMGNRVYRDREVCNASEVGSKAKVDTLRYKDNCPHCGHELWRRSQYIGKPCKDCIKIVHSKQLKDNLGDKHPLYKGYRKKHAGYIMVKIDINDPFYCMANSDGYCFEHRIVYARFLNRPLERWEVIHHENSIRDDNRLENLQLFPGHSKHLPSSLMTGSINRLKKENEKLKSELLKYENGIA